MYSVFCINYYMRIVDIDIEYMNARDRDSRATTTTDSTDGLLVRRRRPYGAAYARAFRAATRRAVAYY